MLGEEKKTEREKKRNVWRREIYVKEDSFFLWS